MLEMGGALVLGTAFGFTLQRGGFCGSSLLSSAVLYRDTRGLVGILLAVLVSMAGFAVLAQLDWIIPNPKPMRLLSAIVGGLVFGVGMVLAGGCVSGTLFKAGEGRLTSMLALLGIGFGSTLVYGGSLAPLKTALVVATREVRWPASPADAFDVSFAALGGTLAGVGLLALLIAHLVRGGSLNPLRGLDRQRLIRGGWSPISAGFAVGILGWIAYLASSAAGRNYPLGANGGVKGAFEWLVRGEHASSAWLMVLVAGIVAGSAISARLRGQLKLRSADPSTLLVALLGGLLVGVGAAVGRGCFIGHGVSGLALLSLHSAIFMVCTIAANWVTTALYLRGLR